jgi:hypothetical protein
MTGKIFAPIDQIKFLLNKRIFLNIYYFLILVILRLCNYLIINVLLVIKRTFYKLKRTFYKFKTTFYKFKRTFYKLKRTFYKLKKLI